MKYILSIILISFVLIQCTPLYYPNTIHAPLLAEEGEGNISGHLGTSGINLQAAYAVNDHIGLMSNTNFIGSSDEVDAQLFTELGVGHFETLGAKGLFEIYGGVGAGTEYYRFFAQPSIGFHSKNADIALTSRFVSLHLYDDLEGGNQAFYIEPAITTKLGLKNVKLIGQFGLSLPLESNTIDHLPILISVGLEYRLFKNKNKPLF